ncbi:hypothetical protein [Methanobrevibacter sp.]|uniref:hypothetical protein n=1 Tax=Methanobrevibacter sp. TaxID=66852 RepID=UPI003866D48C
MTIAIVMKINDGIVLATDSASTLWGIKENGEYEIIHTYFNGDKLFNLKKGSPIGAITWGHGSINNESISTLAKDFRKKFENEKYTSVKDTAEKFKKFLEEKITPGISVGFIIAGYSKDEARPEIFLINVTNGSIPNPVELNKDDPCSISWFGQPRFLTRFLLGYDEQIFDILKANGIEDEVVSNVAAQFKEQLQLNLGEPAMPIQDAIDLVKFLANLSISASRFFPGPQVIGGPVDIAVITKHEDFKWIERKHYYDVNLNLTTGDDKK